MTPFVLNENDEAIIKSVLEKNVSPNEKWADPAVTELKTRMNAYSGRI